MTTDERFTKIEEKLLQIEDNLLVTGRMQIESERRWKEQAEDLRAAQQHTQQTLGLLIERQLITEAALQSLISSINQFVQGHGGNGHSIQG